MQPYIGVYDRGTFFWGPYDYLGVYIGGPLFSLNPQMPPLPYQYRAAPRAQVLGEDSA